MNYKTNSSRNTINLSEVLGDVHVGSTFYQMEDNNNTFEEVDKSFNNTSICSQQNLKSTDGNSTSLCANSTLLCVNTVICDWDIVFEFVFHGVLLNCVGILGLVGNLLSIFILSRPQMKGSTNCILIGLATYDSILIITR